MMEFPTASMVFQNFSNKSVTTLNRSFEETTQLNQPYDPLNPCPRTSIELILGIISGILIVSSNIICIRFLNSSKVKQHQENIYYVVNLGVSNIICGVAILGANILQINSYENSSSSELFICYQTCLVWGPIYIFCIMLPYVTLSTLGIDIARYCHLSFEYQRQMTPLKHCINIITGWLYTILVVVVAIVNNPEIICDQHHWELNIFIIIFPIFLMFLPAVCVVISFTYVMRNYWTSTKQMNNNASAPRISGFKADVTKARLIAKFTQRFSHLIIFSILCSVVYTGVIICEVAIETNTHQRLCILYRVDRVFISLNSLLTPWMHCLATKELRSKIFRKHCPRFHRNYIFPQPFIVRRRTQDTRNDIIANDASFRSSYVYEFYRTRQCTLDVVYAEKHKNSINSS